MDDFIYDPMSVRANDLVTLAAAEKGASKDMKPILREAAFLLLSEMRRMAAPRKSAELAVMPGGLQ